MILKMKVLSYNVDFEEISKSQPKKENDILNLDKSRNE